MNLLKQPNDLLISRFFRTDDEIMKEVIVPLPGTWWSRFYEYSWASKFSGETVLDAACGICHPFKFFLTQTCEEVYACDNDPRILSRESLCFDISYWFGGKGCSKLLPYFDKVKFDVANLTVLPYQDNMFDVIYCISVIEHILSSDKKIVLSEFSRVLKNNGLLVITVDYPDVDPKIIITEASEVGLVLADSVDFYCSPDAINLQNVLYCFRMIFRKQN